MHLSDISGRPERGGDAAVQGCAPAPALRWFAALRAIAEIQRRPRPLGAALTACLAAALAVPTPVAAAPGAAQPPGPGCTAGARTLAQPGSRLYPETGNGGYTSVHTDVDLRYDAAANRLLAGNHVVLSDRATQCLSSFTLDFERRSANAAAGPELTVESVTVNGQPASFRFVQPTYPGDPAGAEDPNPAAHEASQNDPVGGPANNPLPPACSPELLTEEPGARDSLDGTQCPANKLLITPTAPLRRGAAFTVAVFYSGRPGVHNDGEGELEGWFATPTGSFVASEPVGTEAWMPLNDHPSAKPTYDFYETVRRGTVAIGNGVLAGTAANPPDSAFPEGSTTWHWHEQAPVASYLVQSSIGDYSLTARLTPDGMTYYEAQDESIAAAARARNARLIAMMPQITEYESRWGGPFPFASDGALVGTAEVGFEEEMQSMIAFPGGSIQLPVLWHENFHQWWGDNVSEAGYEDTFYKEGLAGWMEEYVYPAHRLTGAAFEATLIRRFDTLYAQRGDFWTVAPSRPYAYDLFGSSNTYSRPASAYEALHRILGEPAFAQTLQRIQAERAGSVITEAQLEQAFGEALPNPSPVCQARLGAFFSEWFDTAYAPGGGSHGRPRITGPGLAGEDFYSGGCGRPAALSFTAPSAPGPAAAGEAPPEAAIAPQRHAPSTP